MELIFGDGCDGDVQARVFAGVRGYNVDLIVNDKPMRQFLHDVSNGNGGELICWPLDEEYEIIPFIPEVHINIDDITRMEIP